MRKVLLAFLLPILLIGGGIPLAFGISLPSICTVSNSTGAQATSVAFTNAESSVSTIINLGSCNTAGTLMVVSIWYIVTSTSAAPIPDLALSDNNSNTYAHEASLTMLACTGNIVGGNCPPANTYQDPMTTFITPFHATHGHLSLTMSSGSNFPYNGHFYVTWMFWDGLNNLSVTNSCTVSQTYDGNGVQGFGLTSPSCTLAAPANSAVYSFNLNSTTGGYITIGQMNFQPNSYLSESLNANNCNTLMLCVSEAGGYVNGPSPSNPSFGFTCVGIVNGCISPPFTWGLIVLTLGGSTTGTPGVGVTSSDWNPSSTTSVSGSSLFLPKDTMFSYQDANGQTGAGTVYNFTTKISGADCTKVYCYLLVGFYMAQTPGIQPSPSNPLLLQHPTYTIAIKNSTSTGTVESINTTVLILPNYYWAVGVMSNSTASRGSGASGTGIAMYEATWPNQMYATTTVSAALPLSTPTGIGSTPPLYFKAALTFPIVTTTSISTSTITTGSYTTTVTLGSTTTVNDITSSSATYWYFPILFLGTGFSLFAGIKIMTRKGA